MTEMKHGGGQTGNMAPDEYEIAATLCEKDPEFKKLWDEHQDLKTRLGELKEKSFLTSEEEIEMKRLKRVKLQGKDKIARMIREYKAGVVPPD